MDAELRRLLDPQALSRAAALGMNARFIVEGHMAGNHRSPYHGFAVEFAQHREYSPGDDVRHLDWKVLGKTDRHYIKQYEQETNYTAYLLLDQSESMRYGSGAITKWHYAKLMAACFSYLILKQRDAVALGLFNDSIATQLARSDNQSQLFKIMASLAAATPSGGTRLGTVLDDLARQLRRKGIVIVISDFLEERDDALLRGLQHLRFQGHEVIAFHLLDPYEIEFPLSGLIEFEGLENLPHLKTRPAEIRESYLEELARHTRWLKETFTRRRCHYIQTNTERPFDEVLAGYLAFRRQSAA